MSASSLFAGSSLDTRLSFLGSRMPVSLLGGKVRGQVLVSNVGDSSQVGQQMLITPLGSPSLWPVCLLGTCAYIPCRLRPDFCLTEDYRSNTSTRFLSHSLGAFCWPASRTESRDALCFPRVWFTEGLGQPSHHLSRGLLKNSITLLQLTAEKREFFQAPVLLLL